MNADLTFQDFVEVTMEHVMRSELDPITGNPAARAGAESYERLFEVARRALLWFRNWESGNGLNGQYDSLLIGQELHDTLKTIERMKDIR